MNVIYTIVAFIFLAFCALAALNVVFGLLFQTFALMGWVMRNLDWLWLPAIIGGCFLYDHLNAKK